MIRQAAPPPLPKLPQTPKVPTTDGPVIAKDFPPPAQAPETYTQVPPPIPYDPNNDMPQGVMVVTIVMVVFASLTVILWPITRALARRMDRGPAGASKTALDPEAADRLTRIEQAVDSIAIEVERISEGQRFTTKLMSEKSAAPLALPSQESRS